MICRECGAQVPEYAQSCPNCGAPVPKTVETNPAPYSPQSYSPQSYALEVDAPSAGLNILSFLIPLVGLIIYLVEKDKSPIKARACGKWALISFIISAVLYIVYFIFLLTSDFF